MVFDPKIEHLRKMKVVVSSPPHSLQTPERHLGFLLVYLRTGSPGPTVILPWQVKERAYQKNLQEKTKALKVRHMKIVAAVSGLAVASPHPFAAAARTWGRRFGPHVW